MHILFVTAEYPPAPGGLGAYTATLGQALTDAGCRVSILTGQATAPHNTPLPVYAEIPRWGWRIGRTVAQRAQELGATWVHVQYQTGAYAMHPAINLAPWAWARTQPRPFCIAWTYHDLLPPYLFPKAGRRLRNWVTHFPARYADLTIVTNEGDRLTLAQRARNLAKIPIGSNIAGSEATPAERQQRRAYRGFDEHDLVIGYFGFLNRSKGGLALVRTLKLLVEAGRRAHLLMIGERVGENDPTNYAYLREVESAIEQLGLTGRVRWTGRQPDEGVSADLHACDLLLMPYEDGASLRRGTLMAGLAHGCAIVTTQPHDPLPEFVDGRDLLYVPPGDAPAMATAVMQIADDPALAQQLRAQATSISRHFAWAPIAQAHLQAYASLGSLETPP